MVSSLKSISSFVLPQHILVHSKHDSMMLTLLPLKGKVGFHARICGIPNVREGLCHSTARGEHGDHIRPCHRHSSPTLSWMTMLIMFMIFSSTSGSVVTIDGNLIVTPKEQLAGKTLENQTCLANISNETKNHLIPRGHCPRVFDGIMCWPPTEPNVSLSLPCPRYVNGFYKYGFAKRTCLPNGTWYLNFTSYVPNCLPRRLHMNILEIIGHSGNGLSIFSLITALTIMIYFKKLHCSRNHIHINLFLAFLLRSVVNFVWSLEKIMPSVFSWNPSTFFSQSWFCRLLSTTHIFTIQATYTWIFIEALYLHNVILIHIMSEPRAAIYIYIAAGWSLPVLMTIVWIILRLNYDNDACWSSNEDELKRSFWMVNLYAIMMVLLNVLLFGNIVRVLFTKMQSRNAATSAKFGRLARSVVVLVIVFGIYYVTFIPFHLMEMEHGYLMIVKTYYEHIMSSYQGFFVSLLFCFVNSEVIAEVKRIFRRHNLIKTHSHANSLAMDAHPNNRRRSRSANEEIPMSSRRRQRIPLIERDTNKHQGSIEAILEATPT